MEKYTDIIKMLVKVLLKLLKGVGLEDAEGYETIAENLIDGAAAALKSDEE